MGRTPQIAVSGSVLRWARQQRGLALEVAARRSGLADTKLEAIEEGQVSPSLAQLQKLAEVYKRPLIVLLLDEPPTTFQALTDYRLLPDTERNAYTPELHDEMWRAIVERETYAELAATLQRPLAVHDLPHDKGDPEQLAVEIRNLLGVTGADHKRFSQKDEAFTFWRSWVEALDVLVLEASRVRLSEMRGLSLSDGVPLVIVINGQDEPRGKVFTLLHELCHLCLGQAGVCDLHTSFNRGSSDVEAYCNFVAGATLLPKRLVTNMPTVISHPPGTPWTDSELLAIRNEAAGASQEAVLRRLVQLGLASRAEYDHKRDKYLAAYDLFRKRNKNSKGGPPPHRMQLRDRGRPFVRSVFDAYGEGNLTLSDVTDLVGLRVKHLDRLQREAFK
jgi:Zn-dependent peptidase ImmA (M78 family)